MTVVPRNRLYAGIWTAAEMTAMRRPVRNRLTRRGGSKCAVAGVEGES